MKKQLPSVFMAAALLAGLGRPSDAARPRPAPHEIAATVTVEDGGYLLKSDGLGAYRNGPDGAIVIQSGGNLGFDTRSSSTGRKISVEFSAPAGGNTQPLPPGWSNPNLFPVSIVTQVVNPGTGAIQGLTDIPVGATWPTQLFCSLFDATNATGVGRVSFAPLSLPGTTYLYSTRSDTNTWTIQSVPGAGLGWLRGGGIDYGLYSLPCRLVIVAQP